jgi:hypothetical protein
MITFPFISRVAFGVVLFIPTPPPPRSIIWLSPILDESMNFTILFGVPLPPPETIPETYEAVIA